MLIDTHCHINMCVKKNFDSPLGPDNLSDAHLIYQQAAHDGVTHIVNVGTSLVESRNCILLAQQLPNNYAAIGIHPNDATTTWPDDLKAFRPLLENKIDNKIVAIGEVGMDKHYKGYNIKRQADAFKAQIELALEYDLALIVHTRDAPDETLRIIEEYKNDITRGIIHCFSESSSFANTVIEWGFALGIGGTLTYPKNNELREIFSTIDMKNIVLETDAPFLPPQSLRGKRNAPKNIVIIARYLAELRGVSFDTIAQTTTDNAFRIFNIKR